jgi:hypothetical protein
MSLLSQAWVAGYAAGVKNPVAVPKSRKTPSGLVSETSKLQVTSSPCGLRLDLANLSVWVGPRVG